MPLDLPPSLARKLIADPIMAAKVIMGAEFDVFQQAKFKLMWFTPEYMDHSGVSVGKTELIFVWVFLRLILLPLHMIGRSRVVFVYYISQGTAERVFLPKLDEYIARSKIFQNELKRQQRGKYYVTKKNVIIIEMRNGGRCEIPAGDFMNDSDNAASTRGNDLVLDEIQLIEAKGKGVDKQLTQRNTQECFNPNHPVHCNHTVYLGHAESPSHPSYKRYANMRRQYRKHFSQDVVTITSSFQDFQGEYYEKFGQTVEKRYKKDLVSMDSAEVAHIYHGLWARGTRGVYSATLVDGILSSDAVPLLNRKNPETIFSLGWDSAPGMQSGSDPNFGVVWAADPVRIIPSSFDPGYMRIGEMLWYIRPVYAVTGTGWDVDQRSGLIHRLDRAFGFSVLALDSQGGGAEVYKKLRESRQFIDNQWIDIGSGLCTPADSAAWPLARPLVHFYDRGDPLFREEFGQRYVSDQSGPTDFMHREVRGLMRSATIAWPSPLEQRGAENLASLTPEQCEVLRELEIARSHYLNITVKVGKDGKPLLSERGFQRYSNSGKKDGAMSSNYGLISLIARLKAISGMDHESNDECGMDVFSSH